MDYFSLGILGLSILTIVLGFLLGLFRGLKRSALRTVILLLCIVGAFFLKGIVGDTIKNIKIGENTINDTVLGLFSGNELLSKIEEELSIIIQCLMEILVYILSLLILQFLSWIIIYPICKIFVRKPKKGKKKKLLGGIVGAVSGLVMCIALFAPISGLVGNVSSLASSIGEVGNLTENKSAVIEIETFGTDIASNIISLYDDNNNEDTSKTENDGSDFTKIFDSIGINEFKDSFIAKTYQSVGGWYYNLVSTVKTKNGKTTNFDTQIGALNGAIRLASNVMKISEMNFEEMFNGTTSFDDFESLMAELDDIKGTMNDEQKEVLTDMIQNTVGTLLNADTKAQLNINFDTLDISNINFTNEAKLFKDFSKLSEEDNNMSEAQIETLINDFADSEIMINVIKDDADSFDIKTEVEENKIKGYIEATNASNEKKAILAKLFKVSLDS